MSNANCPTCGCNRRHRPLVERKPVEQRFWEKVDRRGDADCWLWQAAKVHGHGRFEAGNGIHLAHRYSFYLHYGWLPDSSAGGMVCHRCDVKACVNPAHLYAGNQETNMRDAVERSRHSFGERNSSAKLTAEQVVEIRKRSCDGASLRELGREFDVTYAQIRNVVRRINWKSVP